MTFLIWANVPGERMKNDNGIGDPFDKMVDADLRRKAWIKNKWRIVFENWDEATDYTDYYRLELKKYHPYKFRIPDSLV